MLKITYNEYLKYEELYGKTERENQNLFVVEESEEYIFDKNNEHDKVFRDVLSIKEEKNILSKVMILEKSKNEAEFIENVKEILEIADNRNIDKLKDIIIYKAYDALEQEELEEMLNKMKNKKEESIMTLGERIRRNEREERMKAKKEGIKEGTKQSRTKAIINLIKLNVDETIISKAMETNKEEIEKIKASMVN